MNINAYFQFRDRYEKSQYDLKQAIEDREALTKKVQNVPNRS